MVGTKKPVLEEEGNHSFNKIAALLRLEKNLWQKLCLLLSDAQNIEVIHDADATLVRSTYLSSKFNFAIDLRTPDRYQSTRLQEIGNFYAERQLCFSLWVSPSSQPESLIPRLKRHSYQLIDTIELMALNPATPPDFWPSLASPQDLQIKSVSTKSLSNHFCDVMEAHDAPNTKFFRGFAHFGLGADSPYRRYVGFLGGKPVVIGSIFQSKNTFCIHDILTHPDHDGQDLSKAMIQFLFKKMAKNKDCTLGAFVSSSDLVPFYGKVGFENVGNVSIFEMPAPLPL